MTPARRRADGRSSCSRWSASRTLSAASRTTRTTSGGMRQRVMIAMALACNPSLILADEPTTALDVTIQAQILELMRDLSRRLGIAMLLITHDLGVVARYADRVNVMYAGRIIERASAAELFANPRHPYTLGLLHSVPRLDEPRRARLDPIDGQPPDLTRLPPGCAFAPRCAYRVERCAEVPPLHEHWIRSTLRRAGSRGPCGERAAAPRRDPGQAFPRGVQRRRGASSRRRRASKSRAERPWASSASPAAARPRPAAASCSSNGRPRGRVLFEGEDLAALDERSFARCAATCRSSSRTLLARSTRA